MVAFLPRASTALSVAVFDVSRCMPCQHYLVKQLIHCVLYLNQEKVCTGFGQSNGNCLPNAPCATCEEDGLAFEGEGGRSHVFGITCRLESGDERSGSERINVSYLAARIKPRNIKLSPDYHDFQDTVGQNSGAIWERAEDGLDAVPRIEIVPIWAGIGESDPEAGAVGGPHSTLRLLLSAWKWGFTASLGTEKPSMHAELASLLHLLTGSCESFAVAKVAKYRA